MRPVILAGVREILLVEEGDRVGEEDGRPLGDEVAGDPSAGGGPLLGHEGGDVGVAMALAQKSVQVPGQQFQLLELYRITSTIKESLTLACPSI